jgi:hypothetical protein
MWSFVSFMLMWGFVELQLQMALISRVNMTSRRVLDDLGTPKILEFFLDILSEFRKTSE